MKLKALLIASLIFVMSSCASILNGKYQDVKITSSKNLNVECEKLGLERELDGEMEYEFPRNRQGYQLITKRTGYKDEYYAAIQIKRSPLYHLSFLPPWVIGLAPLFDTGKKACNYSDEIKVDRFEHSIPKRDSLNKFILVDNITLDIDLEDFNKYILNTEKVDKKLKKNRLIDSTQYEQFFEARNTYNIDTEKPVKIQATKNIFDKSINEFLTKYQLSDTTGNVLFDETNTLKLSAKVIDLKIFTFASPSANKYYVSSGVIEWKIHNIYGETYEKQKLTSYSGEILKKDVKLSTKYSSSTLNSEVAFSMKDMFENSILEFLQIIEGKDFLKVSKSKKLDQLKLAPPVNLAKNIPELVKSSITVQNLNRKSHGSGFFINNDGYLITNYHVIAKGDSSFNIITSDGNEIKAKLIRGSQKSDLAILKANIENQYCIVLDTSHIANLRDEIFVIGTPTSVELTQTLTKGIISSIRSKNGVELIQTDASVNFGNSGGPIATKDGKLIGVVNSKFIGHGVEGIAFAIATKNIFKFLNINFSKE